MPIEPNGWDTAWNVPDSELTPQQRRALQEWARNNMWADRLRRSQGRRPPARQTSRPSAQEAHKAEERRRAAEQKRNREWNQTVNWSVAVFVVVSIVCLVAGKLRYDADPSSQLAGALVAIGIVGCILIVPAFIVASMIKK